MRAHLQAIVFIWFYLIIKTDQCKKLVRPLSSVIDSRPGTANDASQPFTA